MSGYDNTSETFRVVTAAATVTANDYVVFASGFTGAGVITLPNAATVIPGRTYTIVKDAAAFAVTVTPIVGTVNGAANFPLAASAYHGVTVISDGTNWIVKSSY